MEGILKQQFLFMNSIARSNWVNWYVLIIESISLKMSYHLDTLAPEHDIRKILNYKMRITSDL